MYFLQFSVQLDPLHREDVLSRRRWAEATQLNYAPKAWSLPLGSRKDKVATHTVYTNAPTYTLHAALFFFFYCAPCVVWITEAPGVLLNSLIYFQHLQYLSPFSIHSKLKLLVLNVFYIHKPIFPLRCLSKLKLLWRGELETVTNAELTHATCRVFENRCFISFLILLNCRKTSGGPCISHLGHQWRHI